MTIRPILFSAPMVRALLEGRKTQTRRILKPQPEEHPGMGCTRLCFPGKGDVAVGDPLAAAFTRFSVGDLLYARETWAVSSYYDGVKPRDVPRCGVRYAATDGRIGIKDRVAIFMPRWASRVTLQVMDVRVQRLQDISEGDARAEGIFELPNGMWRWAAPDPADPKQTGFHTARGAYDDLWGQINGPESWPSNPWIVALTFKVHKANVDALANAKQEVAA